MLSRRGFLIGAGSLLTAAFVKDAQSFVSRTRRPLLETPPEVAQTLNWYNTGNGLLLTIGAYRAGTAASADMARVLHQRRHRAHHRGRGPPHLGGPLIWPEDYDEPVNERYWYDWFDLEGGPVAKAYRLLDGIDLGPDLGSAREGPHLAFEEGAYPGDNSRWVQASGKLALSLLQARLIDLNLPISIAKGRTRVMTAGAGAEIDAQRPVVWDGSRDECLEWMSAAGGNLIRPLCRNCGATIHRSFTCVSFGDPPPNVRRYGENPHGKDFPDSIAEVERLTGRIAVDVRWRQDVERWIDWAKLWDGESYRDRHFCGRLCA